MSKVEEEKEENEYRNESNVYKFPRVKLEADQVTPSYVFFKMFTLTQINNNLDSQPTYM